MVSLLTANEAIKRLFMTALFSLDCGNVRPEPTTKRGSAHTNVQGLNHITTR